MAAYHRVYDYVTCGLTAYRDRGQLRPPRSYRVWDTFAFTYALSADKYSLIVVLWRVHV